MSTRALVTSACIAAMITSVKVVVSPVVPFALQTPVLPENLPFLTWQKVSRRLDDQTGRYRYRRGEDRLNVEVALQQGGNLMEQISQRWDIPDQEISIRRTREIGEYGVFADKRAAYLTACIPPNGLTTITTSQFTINQIQQAVNPQRALTHFFDYASLTDSRCLWVTLSTPLDSDSLETASFRTLQSAWFELNLQWQPTFPER